MDADGIWNGLIETPIGKQKVLLELATTETTVSGTATHEGTQYPVDGTVDGDRLKWKLLVKKPFSMTLSFDITVTGDELSGKVKPGVYPAVNFTGERATDGAEQ